MGVFDIFEQSPFQVIEAVYPGVFKPWQFANVPLNCWKDEVWIEETMEWLLFQQLCFSSYEEALVKLKVKHFHKYRLTGLFQRAFNSRLETVKQWIGMKVEKEEENEYQLETNCY